MKKHAIFALCFFMVLDLRLTIDGRRDDGHLFFMTLSDCSFPGFG